MYTMQYYSAMRKKKILPFVTTWMNLEGIMLSKINQIQKDKYCMKNLKQSNSQKQSVEWWLPGTGGKCGDAGQGVQNLLCKMSKFWRSNVE